MTNHYFNTLSITIKTEVKACQYPGSPVLILDLKNKLFNYSSTIEDKLIGTYNIYVSNQNAVRVILVLTILTWNSRLFLK